MNILIVCSANSGSISPFISDQVEALKLQNVNCTFFTIQGKGIFGYFKHYFLLKKRIKAIRPDLIHAHYGLSGLLANLQRRVPVITTYHGSDINILQNLFFSKLCILLSKYNIFVSNKIAKKANAKNKFSIIPCGVNLNVFYPIDQFESRLKLNFHQEDKIILFSSSFENSVKNYPLAKSAVEMLNNKPKLLELKNLSRKDVNLFINACDVAILTSKSEGSPQFIKECLACNCPIVSTDVGDVRELIKNIEGCYISDQEANEFSTNIAKALTFKKNKMQTSGRDKILQQKLDNASVTFELFQLYSKLIKSK